MWICEIANNGKVTPIREIVECYECVHRSLGEFCPIHICRKRDWQFCSEGERPIYERNKAMNYEPINDIAERKRLHALIEGCRDELQAEWIETPEGTVCSNCRKHPYDDGEYHIAYWHSEFCPHCGKKMKRSRG